MMPNLTPQLQQAIEQIHAAPVRLVLEFAGAGSLALYWLHSVAGSSRTILEASDRYATTALADLLGAPPQQYVADATARAMAARAYQRAQRLSDGDAAAVGIGCTATIATDRTKRGAHACRIAVQNRTGVWVYGLELHKGARDRAGEEAVVGQLLLHAIARNAGIAVAVSVELVAGEQITEEHSALPDPIAQLLGEEIQSVVVHANGQRAGQEPFTGALLSGSFNPLHIGHEQLAQAAATTLDLPFAFELPILNADKPQLSYAEIERRLAQFTYRYRVILSRAPLFEQKATLFPNCTFVIGYDTAVRILEPRYYGGPAERDAALAHIRAQRCRFLVAGRVRAGVFHALSDLRLPTEFAPLFTELPEHAFRVDISSTAIREQLQGSDE